MKRISYSRFILLGSKVRYVLEAKAGHPVHGHGRIERNLKEILDLLP